MTFAELCQVFNSLEEVSSRLIMRDHLAKLFAQLNQEEIAMASYMIAGRIAPLFLPVEFNISDKILYKALQQAASASDTHLVELKKKHGDIGNVAESLRAENTSGHKKNSIETVYKELWALALISGSGSVQKRIEKVGQLFDQLSPLELRYIARLLVGKMRLGVSDKSIIDSLSVMAKGDTSERPKIEQAYGQCSDIGLVASLYQQYGLVGLDRLEVLSGVPIASKLVERESTMEKIWQRIPQPIVQPKYDGLRAQIHVYKASETERPEFHRVWTSLYQHLVEEEQSAPNEYHVELFSRNLERLTPMFPEVVEEMQHMAKALRLKNLILDSEVIGYNSATEEFLLFQDTMKRRRKHNISESVSEFPIKVFSFDILLHNGQSQLNTPLTKRLDLLQNVYQQYQDNQNKPVGELLWQCTPIIKPKDLAELTAYFQQEVSQGLEGVIVKDPESVYEPGTRNFAWLKFKKAMDSRLADTVDVVILGYYRGQGRLSRLGIGALLTGVYDREQDRFVTISKLGTGVTYQQWEEIKNVCDQYAVPEIPHEVIIPASLRPDVALTPQVVIEVEADQVTKSPLHSSGYALRFPRFKKFREKQPQDSTNLSEIKELTAMSESPKKK